MDLETKKLTVEQLQSEIADIQNSLVLFSLLFNLIFFSLGTFLFLIFVLFVERWLLLNTFKGHQHCIDLGSFWSTYFQKRKPINFLFDRYLDHLIRILESSATTVRSASGCRRRRRRRRKCKSFKRKSKLKQNSKLKSNPRLGMTMTIEKINITWRSTNLQP